MFLRQVVEWGGCSHQVEVLAVGPVGLVGPVMGVMEVTDGDLAEYCLCMNTWRWGWGHFRSAVGFKSSKRESEERFLCLVGERPCFSRTVIMGLLPYRVF